MIYETIIISTDAQSQPHIAPFGVREQEGMVVIAPFRPSTTLDNLLSRRTATMNMVDDVRIFAGALTGRRSWPVRQAEKIDGLYAWKRMPCALCCISASCMRSIIARSVVSTAPKLL